MNFQFLLEYSFSVYVMLHALDNFASTILGFKDDDLILAIPISAQVLGIESVDDSSTGPSAESSRTQAGKCKAAATSPPLKKIKKVNDPAPKPLSTPTPPKGPHGKFTMR
jgi:hypothetical protein